MYDENPAETFSAFAKQLNELGVAYLEVVDTDSSAAGFATALRAADLLTRSRAFGQADEVIASIHRRYDGKLRRDDELDLLTIEARSARAPFVFVSTAR